MSHRRSFPRPFAPLRAVLPALALLTVLSTFGQTGQRDLVQFSGVVVTGDSLLPVPFTNILIKNSYRGTMSDTPPAVAGRKAHPPGWSTRCGYDHASGAGCRGLPAGG